MLAYVDSVNGLVPCKVFGASPTPRGWRVRVIITASRPNWPKGSTDVIAGWEAVPRSAVYRSRQACGQLRIRPYEWRALVQQHNIPAA